MGISIFPCKAIPLEIQKTSQSEKSTEDNDDYNVRIIMPIQWINKVFEFDYKDDSNSLAGEFADIITPSNLIDETNTTQHNLYQDEDTMPWYINCMITNIDEEPEPEIIALFGLPMEVYQVLLVFKKIDKDWYLLYYEPFYMHYNKPELYIANNYSQNKVFFIRKLHHRGSGIFQDAHHFYKLIDGKVYPCLVLLNESRIYGWGLILNQDINTNFKFYSSDSDELWVTYNYHFFAGPVFEEDVPWEAHTEISFVKGKDATKYTWNNERKKYIPIFYTYSPDNLTEEKIKCFWTFGDDELFIKAFDYEIKKTLEKGTKEEKEILKWYIDKIKKTGSRESIFFERFYKDAQLFHLIKGVYHESF
jgi:hypothetical protein